MDPNFEWSGIGAGCSMGDLVRGNCCIPECSTDSGDGGCSSCCSWRSCTILETNNLQIVSIANIWSSSTTYGSNASTVRSRGCSLNCCYRTSTDTKWCRICGGGGSDFWREAKRTISSCSSDADVIILVTQMVLSSSNSGGLCRVKGKTGNCALKCKNIYRFL